MANPRVSVMPLRGAVASQELLAAKRREYLALVEIAQDSAKLKDYLKVVAAQQGLMADGAAVMSNVMGNWLTILRTVSLYAEDAGRQADAGSANGAESIENSGDSKASRKMLLRVELDEEQRRD